MRTFAAGRALRQDTLVLCYHSVSERWPELLAVQPRRFEAQVSWLLNRGWAATTFTEAVVSPPARKTLAITFDDGFASVFRLAGPILRRLRVPGTVFVPTEFPDSGRPLAWPHIDRWLGTPHETELAPASWAELAALADAGWEIGSHTVTHPRLGELEPDRLEVELRSSKAEIEDRLGGRCHAIAYPYGDVNERVASAAEEAGYEAGGVLLPARHGRDRLRYPRVFVSSAEGNELRRRHLSRSFRWLQSTAVWPDLEGSLRRPTRIGHARL